jgi:hypothetical protein
VLPSTGLADRDGKKNGIVETKPLKPDVSHMLDRMSAPKGYRLVGPNEEVTTLAGKHSTATSMNLPKG